MKARGRGIDWRRSFTITALPLNLAPTVELQWPLQSEGGKSGGLRRCFVSLCACVFAEGGWALQLVYAQIHVYIAYVWLNAATRVYLVSICLNVLEKKKVIVCLHIGASDLIWKVRSSSFPPEIAITFISYCLILRILKYRLRKRLWLSRLINAS